MVLYVILVSLLCYLQQLKPKGMCNKSHGISNYWQCPSALPRYRTMTLLIVIAQYMIFLAFSHSNHNDEKQIRHLLREWDKHQPLKLNQHCHLPIEEPRIHVVKLISPYWFSRMVQNALEVGELSNLMATLKVFFSKAGMWSSFHSCNRCLIILYPCLTNYVQVTVCGNIHY